MKAHYIFLSFIIFIFPSGTMGQDTVYISEGTVLSISETTTLHFSNLNLSNSGEIAGNHGALHLSSENQSLSISGQPFALKSLILDVAQGTSLKTSLAVEEEVRLLNGNLDIGDSNLTLGEKNGRISGEANSRRITGSKGQIIKHAMLNGPEKANPGKLGIEISSQQHLGLTEIRRGHTSVALPAGTSTSRYYQIVPEAQVNSDWLIRLHFFSDERNQADLPHQIWKQQGGRWISMRLEDQPVSENASHWLSATDFEMADRYTAGPEEDFEEELSSIPTAFTPNGDGLNDEFIIPWIQYYPEAVISIFNRWGEKVYEGANYHKQAWNGFHKGQALAPGSFYYIIRLPDGRGPLKGKVSIVR